MQNVLSYEKRTLEHWATVQLFFSLAQVRCFWRCFCFRSVLVSLFLKMSERGDSWCTDSSFSSVLVKLSKCLNRLCLTVFSSLRSSLLLVHIFLTNLYRSANFGFNMLWYSTPWTSPPPPPSSSNDPLWLTLFVEVSMIIFWTIAKSAVFSIIVLSMNKRDPEFILYGWSFIETQM